MSKIKNKISKIKNKISKIKNRISKIKSNGIERQFGITFLFRLIFFVFTLKTI